MTTKICKDCKIEKPLLDYYKDAITPDGHAYRCKPCNNLKVKKYKKSNPEKDALYDKRKRSRQPEKYLEYSRNWYKNNKPRYKETKKIYVLKNPRKQKEQDLKRYKLTLEMFDLMLLTQKHKCKICLRDFTEKRRPYVDHCHSIGKVRGLLCNRCNLMLGGIKENIPFLSRMIKYLKLSKPLQHKIEL